jgi:hypothetical protein
MERFRTISQRLPDDLRARVPEGLPSMRALQDAIDRLSQEEIASKVTAGLERLDRQQLVAFGEALESWGIQNHVAIPPGLAAGNPKAIGLMFASMAKSEKGMEQVLRFLQLAGGGRGLTGAALAMSPLRRGGLMGMFANPQTRSAITSILSSLVSRKPGGPAAWR